jgi:hypothetical protein
MTRLSHPASRGRLYTFLTSKRDDSLNCMQRPIGPLARTLATQPSARTRTVSLC